ncbi:MAG: SUMF1/EgtB/PvdO family nonheme iron enzyme [Myxococcales bacterium]
MGIRGQGQPQLTNAAPRTARQARRTGREFWQGEFPREDSGQDGFHLSAPVGCYPSNPFGLFDTLGNVWEWTQDLYSESHDQPAGQAPASCSDPSSNESLVIKGGSFLCSKNFCARYRVTARHPQEANLPTMHLGFRTVRSIE